MEISKDEPILKNIEMINEDIKTNSVILNFYNYYNWTNTEFNNLTSILRSNYSETVNEEILEVSRNSTILTISNLKGIVSYLNTNNYKNTIHKWTNCENLKNFKINDLFDVDLDLNVYKKDVIEPPLHWNEELKKYKFIKQFNYDLKNGIIVVARIIKTSNLEFETLKKSGILTSSNQEYEFSLIINDTKHLISSIILCLKSLFLSNIILTKKQQKIILEEYFNLIKKDINLPPYYKEIPLITPKPATLEMHNLVNPDEYGAISILRDYCVTEKADGERLLMYVNNNGNIYLIDNLLKVEDTGMKAKKELFNSLLDGEYIRYDKRNDKNKKNIYAVFDIYYLNNKCLTSLPLIGGRYDEMLKVSKLIDLSKSNFEFITKTHYYSNDIISNCREILMSSDKYKYDIDGLIFTPAKLAVYSYYPSIPVQITQNNSWDRVFKWKPPEQNTIDFLVKYIETVNIDGIPYKKLGLYVGFNPMTTNEFSIEEGFKLRYDKNYSRNKMIEEKEKKKNNEDYIAVLFKPVKYYYSDVEYIFIKIDDKGNIRTQDNEIILTDTIVECNYDLKEKKWMALRIRYDKTNLYKKGIIAKTANNYVIALNIWNSIHNPISKEVIIGSVSLENKTDIGIGKELEADDIYYTRGIPRKFLLSYNMMSFHNLVINDMLYSKPKIRSSLLELACGQASGLTRWISAGYEFILGIDYAKNNIYKAIDGSYARVLNEYTRFNKIKSVEKGFFPNIAFAVGDCSLDIKTGVAGIDEESKELLKIVLNNNYKSTKTHYKYINGRGANKFNVVSCMFAIHYFFESEEKLEGFLNNVTSNIKKDGIFMCSFMDGDSVERALGSEGIIEGRRNLDNTNILVWAIIKRFIKEDGYYNKKIDVFIENTRRLIPEYLVNFDFLIEKAKQFGLELVESELFSQSFNDYMKKINKKKLTSLDNIMLNLDKEEIQKKFSFFNRWAIFKKID